MLAVNVLEEISRFTMWFCDVVLHPATLFCIFAQGTDFLEISALAGQDAQGLKDFKDWLIENMAKFWNGWYWQKWEDTSPCRSVFFLTVFSLIFPTASAIALPVTAWSPVSTRFTIQVGDVRGWCSQWRNCHWHWHCQRPRGSLTCFTFYIYISTFEILWDQAHLCLSPFVLRRCPLLCFSSLFISLWQCSIAHHASLSSRWCSLARMQLSKACPDAVREVGWWL